MLFKLNCGYYPHVFLDKNTNSCSESKTANELSVELQELMTVCQKNLYHTQRLQKQAYNKGVKPNSYAPGDKVWLNSNYIKTKQNRKLEAKFFRSSQVLHLVGKQAYKLKPPKKGRIHNVFHVLLLEQDIIKKERVRKVPKLDAGDNSKEYEVEAIWDIAVYAMKLESDHLPRLYYLVAWKGYSKKKNTWEPVLAVQYLRKLISLFHKDHQKKPTAIFPPVNFALPIAKLIIKPTAKSTTKQKQGRPANSANKQAKKNWTFCSFPHVTFLWPNQDICLLGFYWKTLSNNFSYCQFSFFSSYWVKRFFYRQYFSTFFSASLRG